MKQFGTDVLAMTIIVGGATVAVAATLAFVGETSSEATFVVATRVNVVAPHVNELARMQDKARVVQIEIHRGQQGQRILVKSRAHIDFEALERVRALQGLELELQREMGERIHELERFEDRRKRRKRRP